MNVHSRPVATRTWKALALALGLQADFRTTDYPHLAKLDAKGVILLAIPIFCSVTCKNRSRQGGIDDHQAET
jgi:hypothetical protein